MSDLDGAEVLDQTAAFIGPYLSFPTEHCLPAVTLWAAHTHAVRAFYVTPRLVLDSAEPGSGKTRVLELLNLICGRPEMILSPTTAAIFRMLADGPITLLFDEVDAVFNVKNGGNYEDLRALLNAGYKRGNTIPRCVGDAAKMQVQKFKVFAPVALAGLAGNMPATVLTRAVVIHMRKRPVSVKVKAFRERDAEAESKPVAALLSKWMRSQTASLEHARPKMPDGVEDRPAEVWEAMLAIADAAGGDWPDKARAACEHFVLKASSGAQSFGAKLLGDLRRVFGSATAISTAEILERLTALPESMWGDLGGKPMDPRRMAKVLKAYEVEPVPFRDDVSGKTVRGYTTFAVDTKEATSVGLADAWSRYLPDNERNERNEGNGPAQDLFSSVTASVTGVTTKDRVTSVTDDTDSVTSAKEALTSEVTAVTAVTPKTGDIAVERVKVTVGIVGGKKRAIVPPGATYIGRAMPRLGLGWSPFANPHVVGGDKKTPCRVTECASAVHSREEALALFERDCLPGLVGEVRKVLAKRPTVACWCPLDLPCHGDLLIAVLNDTKEVTPS